MPVNPREGQPIWIEYTCHEFESTTSFYSEIFGWEFTDQGPDFGHYNMITKDGSTIGGAMRAVNMDGTPNPMIPAMWTTYLKTADISAVYAKALEAGAAPIVDPLAVGPLGHMGVITDPTGAGVGLWQPGEFSGFDTPLTPGTPVWFELMTLNYPLALEFYRDVFSFDITEMEGYPYATHGADEDSVAGIFDASQWSQVSYWRYYINVEDTDATATRISELGGTILAGPESSPYGRIATVADPEGATLQLQQNP
ncbi:MULTISPECIES: VOC family protein [unclassified Brevibacterium]|uniref:VOC family protein n=1 Tax=unclassified Brevibacterium TaxID=2614124 RepID=UPI0010926097|nr:VOC family protein [Brevibacterium sp. S22]TGD28477.1 VOC family protein [Brevibacterium sp. S22]